MTYDNIESHKKPGFHLLFRSCISEKNTGGIRFFLGFRVNKEPIGQK